MRYSHLVIIFEFAVTVGFEDLPHTFHTKYS